jgi:hypothetical protein
MPGNPAKFLEIWQNSWKSGQIPGNLAKFVPKLFFIAKSLEILQISAESYQILAESLDPSEILAKFGQNPWESYQILAKFLRNPANP